MKKNLPSRALNDLQRGIASKESLDCFSALLAYGGSCAARSEASER